MDDGFGHIPRVRGLGTSRPGGLQRADAAPERFAAWPVAALCVPLLIWPALWNGYPIVFADTGTYLSQAMHRYLGWDRPLFYSVFIYPLHLGLTTWPVIVVQSVLTIYVLDLTRRAFGVSRWWLLALVAFLAVATSLPWIVSELMPDLMTPLLVILLAALIFAPGRFRAWELAAMTGLAAFMVSAQSSSVPLTAALLVVLLPARWIARRMGTGPRVRPGWFASAAPLLAPALAIAALIGVNVVGFGRASLSPFGNVFVLARVIYDGPGMAVLRRDCPSSGWRLCPWLDRFPLTADDFLWTHQSPIILAGGHKAVSADADAIIRAAVIAQPLRLLAATWDNTLTQLTLFGTGDGIEHWDTEVDPWIDKDFPPRERAAYHAARQQRGTLSLAVPLDTAQRIIALIGIAAAALLLPLAWRRRHAAAWFLMVALLTLPVSAAVTGGLSTPHDRYQSRIVWLPACMALLSLPALFGSASPGRQSPGRQSSGGLSPGRQSLGRQSLGRQSSGSQSSDRSSPTRRHR